VRGQLSKATSESVDARTRGPTLDLEITTKTPPARAPSVTAEHTPGQMQPVSRSLNRPLTFTRSVSLAASVPLRLPVAITARWHLLSVACAAREQLHLYRRRSVVRGQASSILPRHALLNNYTTDVMPSIITLLPLFDRDIVSTGLRYHAAMPVVLQCFLCNHTCLIVSLTSNAD
jgi:hypothetical protein